MGPLGTASPDKDRVANIFVQPTAANLGGATGTDWANGIEASRIPPVARTARGIGATGRTCGSKYRI